MARLSALALVLPAILATSRPDTLEGADRWFRARSPHFVVVSNAGERSARQAAHQFEQLRALFEAGFKARLDPGVPFVILALKDEASFRALASDYWGQGTRADGLFMKGADRHYALLRLDAGDPDEPYHVLYHEYVHLLTSLNYPWVPRWLDEGLAEFYASTEIGEKEVRWGSLHASHVAQLRDRRRPSRSRALTADGGSLSGSMSNAQAAVTIHYLLVGSPERRGQLSAYLKLLLQDVPESQAFARTIGEVSKLERELSVYVRRSAFAGFKAPLRLDRPTATVELLSDSDAAAIQADVLIRHRRLPEARGLLDKALAAAPGSALVQEALGLLALAEKRAEDARRHLVRAVELAPDNSLALYHAALADETGEATAEGRARRECDLRRVIELTPGFAAAHGELASLLLDRDATLAEGLAEARLASELDPGELWYRKLMKYAWERVGRPEEAARVERSLRRAAGRDWRELNSMVAEYEEREQFAEADSLLRELHLAEPQREDLVETFAWFLTRRNRAAEAEALARRALARAPGSPDLQSLLADLLFEAGDKIDEAVELSARAVKARGNGGTDLAKHGQALLKAGRLAEAEKALRRSLAALPDMPLAQMLLGDALWARGNRAGAREQWSRALASPDFPDFLKAEVEAKVRQAER